MNALHSTTTAVLQPLPLVSHQPVRNEELRPAAAVHTAARGVEKSGATGGRGCARGTGRGVIRNRPPFFTAIEGGHGGHGGVAYGEATGASGDLAGPATGGEEERRTSAEADFTAYVQERRASLYATAYHLTGDRFEAEDLLQSALFSTYRAWDRISDKAAVGGYLRRTMTNLHISAWRRRKLNEYPTEELPETVGDCDEMRGTELRAVLWQALAKLPETQRTMLVLRYYEGRTDPEIAGILGISVGTVKSSIWRSLRRLREDQTLSAGVDEEGAFGELVA